MASAMNLYFGDFVSTSRVILAFGLRHGTGVFFRCVCSDDTLHASERPLTSCGQLLTNKIAPCPVRPRTHICAYGLIVRTPAWCALHLALFHTASPLEISLESLKQMVIMFGFTSFSASDEELERSALSSEHSFVSADGHADVITPSKRTRRADDSERPRQRRKLSPPLPSTERNTQFACPFAKHDPLRHRRCFRYKMDQISRLKYMILHFNTSHHTDAFPKTASLQSPPGPYSLRSLFSDIQL